MLQNVIMTFNAMRLSNQKQHRCMMHFDMGFHWVGVDIGTFVLHLQYPRYSSGPNRTDIIKVDHITLMSDRHCSINNVVNTSLA